MYDFVRGAKVTGSKFYFNDALSAKAEWDNINEMLKYHQASGYTFIIPPFLVNKKCAEWAGILPRFDGDFYETTDGLLLIPTAETPLVGLHADEILPIANLPIKYVALSPCFRREAGAGGTRDAGLRRVHQFFKVELFIICKPEDSEHLHQEMLDSVCHMLTTLWPQLKYRVITLSEKDRSPMSAKTYDIELQFGNEWLEVSSISNTEDRQSKLAQIRYRPTDGGKPIKCHLLNGSGVALPRLMLALSAEKEITNT